MCCLLLLTFVFVLLICVTYVLNKCCSSAVFFNKCLEWWIFWIFPTVKSKYIFWKHLLLKISFLFSRNSYTCHCWIWIFIFDTNCRIKFTVFGIKCKCWNNYYMYPCLFGGGRNDFDAGNIHYQGHWKGWARVQKSIALPSSMMKKNVVLCCETSVSPEIPYWKENRLSPVRWPPLGVVYLSRSSQFLSFQIRVNTFLNFCTWG